MCWRSGILVMMSPIVVGFLFGPLALSGLLAGALVSGVQIAISSSNTGGAWDNAKKVGVHLFVLKLFGRSDTEFLYSNCDVLTFLYLLCTQYIEGGNLYTNALPLEEIGKDSTGRPLYKQVKAKKHSAEHLAAVTGDTVYVNCRFAGYTDRWSFTFFAFALLFYAAETHSRTHPVLLSTFLSS